MSAPQIRVETLCADYKVRELSESDVPEVLKLYKGNPIYFEHCPPAPSKDSVREDRREPGGPYHIYVGRI